MQTSSCVPAETRCACCKRTASLLISLQRLPLRPSRKARSRFASTKAWRRRRSRWCCVWLSDARTREQAEAEQKRLLKDARKRGKQPDPRSLEAAKYILLLTSLPAAAFPPADILAIYRFRWQIELAFKRFKSLAGLDMLPAKKPELARAWIYARLIVAIIAEQIAGQVPDSSPSGPGIIIRKPIALASHEDSPGHDLRRHSWTHPVANRLQPLQPNPSSSL